MNFSQIHKGNRYKITNYKESSPNNQTVEAVFRPFKEMIYLL